MSDEIGNNERSRNQPPLPRKEETFDANGSIVLKEEHLYQGAAAQAAQNDSGLTGPVVELRPGILERIRGRTLTAVSLEVSSDVFFLPTGLNYNEITTPGGLYVPPNDPFPKKKVKATTVLGELFVAEHCEVDQIACEVITSKPVAIIELPPEMAGELRAAMGESEHRQNLILGQCLPFTRNGAVLIELLSRSASRGEPFSVIGLRDNVFVVASPTSQPESKIVVKDRLAAGFMAVAHKLGNGKAFVLSLVGVESLAGGETSYVQCSDSDFHKVRPEGPSREIGIEEFHQKLSEIRNGIKTKAAIKPPHRHR